MAADSIDSSIRGVTPSPASLHLRKLACFCFDNQRLAPGESFEAPLVFQLTRDLPEEIKTVTLVYTLYPQDQGPEVGTVADGAPGSDKGRRPASGEDPGGEA